MITAAIYCFGIAGLCGTYRLLIGPDLADRVMGLDLTLISLMGAIAVDSARRDDTTYLVLLVVIAIIGFTATVAASKFIEHEHRQTSEATP
ncbi:MAG: multicomponent Na+:H+ antiporter subunit F [Candidatus Aldehydirespiratoraceae bacterium]|jgi:multicomponent Na+:H+ antiporter subunit F